MLQIQHICKEYRTGKLVQKALDDVSLNLRDNEFVAILGPSGSGKTSMSLFTALSLSFNNLRTKKARTLLTSFAGSIGIIGISLILSLSTGVNNYIQNVEEDTLSEYPLQIQSTGMDFTSMLSADSGGSEDEEEAGEINVIQMVTDMFSTMDSNDLESLKEYLDSGDSGIEEYTNAIEYSYDVVPQIYLQKDEDVRQVNPDTSFEALGIGSSSSSSSMMSSMMSTDVFYEMPEDTDLYMDQYDVKAGRWPERYNECVLVLTSGGGISGFMLYTMGLRDSVELDKMIQQFINEENVEVPEDMGTYTYEDILGITFKLVNSADCYEYDEQYQIWRDKTDDTEYMKNLVDQGEDITIVGIVQPSEGANGALLSAGIAYPSDLTEHVVQEAENSEIVQKQLEDHTVNVFTNEAFGEESSQSDFDMNSLITVDERALQEAFQFDESAMTEGLSGTFDFSGMEGIDPGTLDLSGMLDLGSITLDLPEMPEMNLGDLMSSLNIQVTAEDMETMISGLMEGYQAYAQENPQADYSQLGTYFLNYLQTEEAQTILERWGGEIFQTNGEVWVTQDQLEALAGNIAAGYQTYASANGLPDPAQIDDYFMEYLSTEDAQQRLTQGLSTMIDTGSLRDQISQSMEGYMQELMASYSGTLGQALESQISSAMEQMMTQISSAMETAMTQAIAQIGENLQSAMNIDAEAFSNAFTVNMSGDEMAELFMSMNSTQDATYENNLRTLGYVDFDTPSGIDIYPKDFESKESVVNILDAYNSRMEAEGKDEQVITYTDVVGSLMSSVTDIIDIISYVLIAFVAISLVVSSIMIGVITYISVLERKKEIGILRAIGASKGNISQVFNAETFIIGFCAGLLGIIITLLLLIPGNALIHHLAGTNDINAVLQPGYALILILLSVILTLIGGLIPSKKAAKSDPVTALRTE